MRGRDEQPPGAAAALGPAGVEFGGDGWLHWLWAVLPIVAACLWLVSAR